MVHVLVVDDNVVLGRHVVCDVVVNNQSQQAVQKGEVHLLRDVLELALKDHHTLAI